MTTDTDAATTAPHPRRRLRTVTATTLAMLLAVSGLAVADETLVSTSATEPGRQLEVLDLAGAPLTDLALRDGIATPFEVRVSDTDQDPGNGFSVDATMNNLHLFDGTHAAEHIASEHITLSFASDPLAAAGLSVDLEPGLLLRSVTGGISCGGVAASLEVTLTSLLNVLSPDPICDLIADLLNIDLLDLTGTETIAFADVGLVGDLLDAIDLNSLPLGALPLVPGHGTAGNFAVPECSSGIGAAFCDGTVPTVRQTLRGDGAADLSAELETLLQDALAGLALLSQDGVGALASLDDVRAALVLSDAALVDGDGLVVGTVGQLGNALGSYTEAEQWQLVQDLLAATLAELGLQDLLHLTGRYSSYPALTVDTATAPVGGEYQGTLTITLVE